MKYAQYFKTKKRAMAVGKKILKSRLFVYGVRGGKIRSSNARLVIKPAINGYAIMAKRKR